MAYSHFLFTTYDFDPGSGELTLYYQLGDRDGTTEAVCFEERYYFPPPARSLSASEAEALDRTFRALHIAAGISYYKAFCPPDLVYAGGALGAEEAEFWHTFYVRGLSEFYYRNGLPLEGNIHFAADPHASSWSAPDLDSPENGQAPHDQVLVPIGGGKDSVVTAELLFRAGFAVTLVSVNSAPPIRDTARALGLPHIVIRRTLSPALLDLNAKGALNGHVPITGILSFVFLALAIQQGIPHVALSLEQSADVPQIVVGGREVNHQYSKSLAFELQLRSYIEQFIARGITYFSLLRPWHELKITEQFAALTAADGHPRARQTHPLRQLFSSCNRNFSISNPVTQKLWCRACPKCAFVYALFAPWIPRAELDGIFGGCCFEEAALEPEYRSLLGLTDHLPFECIGSAEETRAAFLLAARNPEFRGTAAAQLFEREVLPRIESPETLIERYLATGTLENIPMRFRALLSTPHR